MAAMATAKLKEREGISPDCCAAGVAVCCVIRSRIGRVSTHDGDTLWLPQGTRSQVSQVGFYNPLESMWATTEQCRIQDFDVQGFSEHNLPWHTFSFTSYPCEGYLSSNLDPRLLLRCFKTEKHVS